MWEYAIFLIASFLAATGATLAGFGSSALLIPVAFSFYDLRTAIFLVACFHLFNNLFKIRLFWEKIDFKTFLYFGIPSICFSFGGAALIAILPLDVISKILAVFLIVYAIYSLFKPKLVIKKSLGTAVLGGSLSGFFAGLIGLGGAIRSSFLVAFDLPKEVYV
ncbi:MAG: TSUP family transporter, partial [Candidatus Aminicenantes bacterium]|nr:TSUP family transporter [Candidatus Aminicenantes bacterium]